MKAKTFFSGLFGFFMFVCCEKEPPALPEETQVGMGSFGCLVNGELVYYEKLYGFRPYRPEANENAEGQFIFYARVRFEHEFQFFVSEPELGQCTIDSVFFRPYDTPEYYVARNVQHIRFTQYNYIASGAFAFEADGYDRYTHQIIPSKKIRVDKGRFDVQLNRR